MNIGGVTISDEHISLALQNEKVGLWELDLKSGKVSCTPECIRNLGLSGTSRLSRYETAFANIVSEDNSQSEKFLDMLVRNGTGAIQYKVKHNDKSIRWLKVTGKTIYDTYYKAIKVIGTTVDITELKDLEVKKDNFISIANHEFKTPLTCLKVVFQKFISTKDDNRKDKDHFLFKVADNQINRLVTVLNEIFYAANIASGRVKLDLEEVRIGDILEPSFLRLKNNISHEIMVEGNRALKVWADKKQLELVMSHLLSNAIKYSPNGNRIKISIHELSDKVRISVSDFGIGISQEEAKLLFNKFYRIETTSQNYSGLGLGLYISKEIIEALNGEIQVHSEVGKGSTFSFTLPKP